MQNCAACHGAEGKGLVGSNLTDNTWMKNIQNTITNRVKAKGMPTRGSILGNEKVADEVVFVYSLSHK